MVDNNKRQKLVEHKTANKSNRLRFFVKYNDVELQELKKSQYFQRYRINLALYCFIQWHEEWILLVFIILSHVPLALFIHHQSKYKKDN